MSIAVYSWVVLAPCSIGATGEVSFSAPSGWRNEPFELRLAPPKDGVVIRYTHNGSEPGETSGAVYDKPLTLTNTTVIRAAAFEGTTRVSPVSTRTYLFLEQVIHQPRNPPGLPSGPSAWRGQPSAYGMDPRIVDARAYRDRIQAAFEALPVLSVVCRREDMFGRTGLYLNSLQRGEEWERPCSVEWIPNETGPGFRIDCGIQMQGNFNRIPIKSPKHSFRLLFKEKYGASKLRYPVFPDSPVKKFDTLVLRADYNNSWIHWDPAGRARGQRTRDAWMKDSHRAMGWIAPHNRYVHLFLNGLYWGIYDLAERPDDSFAAAYLGGEREQYDVVNEFQVKAGTRTGFRALFSFRDLRSPASYESLRQQLDLTQFIDYLLLQYYGGNQDWGENKNWYAIRRHTPPAPFQFFVWDGEQVLQDLNDDVVNAPFEVPMRLAEELKENPEYRLAFADRVQKHFFDKGALTPAAVEARWMKRAGQIDLAIIAESARWGSYRRDRPYTRDEDWIAEQQRLLKSYFPKRTTVVLNQLRAAGLYPQIAAPEFRQTTGATPGAIQLEITSLNGGDIVVSTNGQDPRLLRNEASRLKSSQPLSLPLGTQVKARVRKGVIWSALAERTLTDAQSEPFEPPPSAR